MTIPFILSLAACEVGPDYARPDTAMTAAFKEAPPPEGFTTAHPEDAATRGAWWTIFNDSILNELEPQIDISNQTLKQSEAAYRQSQAIVAQARASFFPTVSASGSQQFSQRGSGGVITGSSATTLSGGGQGGTISQGSTVLNSSGGGNGVTRTYDLSASASWEPDVWGRIRRTVEEDVADAQASAADLALARLSAQSSLATDYFELRIEDELQRLLDSTVEDYKKALAITENQYKSGVAAKADVITARTQLEQTEAQAVNVGVLRAQYEHAIAVLVGKAPADFSITPAPLTVDVPVIPADVPATLLQRRPDIAAAERQVAATNAGIGVAVAAFYPDITLSANYGFAGGNLSNLIQSSNSNWSLGPSVAETLFDAGARDAEVAQAKAQYDQSVANYRQTVLTAFQQVEDNLAATRILARQAEIETQTVADAEEAVRLSLNQYRAGVIVYSNVIVAQTTALSNEETALTVRENRLTATVALIQALGGGWDVAQLPNNDQVEDPTYGGADPDACDVIGFLTNSSCW